MRKMFLCISFSLFIFTNKTGFYSHLHEQFLLRRSASSPRSSSPPACVLTHISLICSTVGIIDPEQLLHWVLSFFFCSVPRGRVVGWGPPHPSTTQNLQQWSGTAESQAKTIHKWSSPLHLWRLRRHLFSLFWQAILKSSPLLPPFASSFSNSRSVAPPPHTPIYLELIPNEVQPCVSVTALCLRRHRKAWEWGERGGGAAERHFLT